MVESNTKLELKYLKKKTRKVKIESNKGKLKVNLGHELKESNKDDVLRF